MKFLAALVLSLFCTAGLAQETVDGLEELAPQQMGVVEEIVPVTTPDFEPEEAGQTTFWQYEFDTFFGTETLRLRFGDITVPSDSTVQLIIQDASGEIVETWDGPKIKELAGQWSLPIFGDYARVALVGDRSPVGVRLTIDAVARDILPGVSMSIIDGSQLQPIAAYSGNAQMMRLARPVAKLEFVKNRKSYVCTGFLIGRDRLMTNHHCVATADVCSTTAATFDYQRSGKTIQRGPSIRCAEVIAKNEKLDFAVLRLVRSAGDTYGTLKLARDTGLVDGTPLFIIQHPGGDPKQISFKECAVTTPQADGLAPKADFGHRCDTEGGSSGSPVFSRAGFVIGLHHFGTGEGAFANQNRAVRMSEILDCLNNNDCPR